MKLFSSILVLISVHFLNISNTSASVVEIIIDKKVTTLELSTNNFIVSRPSSTVHTLALNQCNEKIIRSFWDQLMSKSKQETSLSEPSMNQKLMIGRLSIDHTDHRYIGRLSTNQKYFLGLTTSMDILLRKIYQLCQN